MEVDNSNRIFDILSDIKELISNNTTSIAVLSAEVNSHKEHQSFAHNECNMRTSGISSRMDVALEGINKDIDKLEEANHSHYRYLIGLLIAVLGALLAPFFHAKP